MKIIRNLSQSRRTGSKSLELLKWLEVPSYSLSSTWITPEFTLEDEITPGHEVYSSGKTNQVTGEVNWTSWGEDRELQR